MVSGDSLDEARPNPSRRRALLVAFAVAGLAFATALALTLAPAPKASDSPVRSFPRPSDVAATGPTGQPLTFDDGSFGTDLTSDPTGSKSQSKLWIHDGSWWAVLLDGATGEFRIFELDWSTQRWIDTGTLVDERAYARQDVLAAGDALYVVSAGTKDRASHAGRLLRYTFEPATRQYRLDPDYPVQITPLGAQSLTVAMDTTNRLWIAYISELRLYVSRTSPGDFHSWARPFVPPVRGTTVAADQSAIVSYSGSIGVVWSNQTDNAVYFASHDDHEGASRWQETRTIVEGLDIADDHINARVLQTADGAQLFVAAKTSLDLLKPVNQLDPQLFLLTLNNRGEWKRYLYGRVADRHTRPIILLDDKDDELYMFAAAPFGGGQIFVKRSAIQSISFETGRGELFMTSPDDPEINTPTSTKQNVSPATGIVVLAADNATHRYLHGVLPFDRDVPVVSKDRDPNPAVRAGRAPADLINQSFDTLPDGPLVSGAWEVHGGSGDLRVRPGRGARVAQVVTDTARLSARVCRPIPATSGTKLVVDLFASRRVLTSEDASIVSIRTGGTELATVRFGRGGDFVHFDGIERVGSGVRYTPGAWYRAIVTLDLQAQTYSFDLRDARGASVLKRTGVRWRNNTDANPDRLCLATGSGRIGEALWFDNIRVIGYP
jgi:hypothetical protein